MGGEHRPNRLLERARAVASDDSHGDCGALLLGNEKNGGPTHGVRDAEPVQVENWPVRW